MGGEGGGWQSVLPKIRDKLRTAFLVAVLHSSSVQRAAALLGRVLGGPGVWGWGGGGEAHYRGTQDSSEVCVPLGDHCGNLWGEEPRTKVQKGDHLRPFVCNR